jgi:mono/diheme cytochrome c family protein
MNMRTDALTPGSLCIAVALAGFAAGCGKDTPTTPTTPTPTVTFSTQIQQQILTPACTGCHSDEGRTPSSNLNLRSGVAYSQLVGVPSLGKPGAIRVIAGNASGSYLIQKLEGAADIAGARMPRNGPPFLTTEQVALIRQWITNGAPNN